ncbi:MAG: hypothetical protein QXP38_05885 [Nitrososphaerota archaeon]
MAKRGIVIFIRDGNIEQLVREVSDYIISRGGRLLYRKVSTTPVFVVYDRGAVDGEQV